MTSTLKLFGVLLHYREYIEEMFSLMSCVARTCHKSTLILRSMVAAYDFSFKSLIFPPKDNSPKVGKNGSRLVR